MSFIYAEELRKPYQDLTVSTIEVPENSVAIKAQVINGLHFVWLIGDPDKTTVSYKFTTSKVDTKLGLSIQDDQRYIDTIVDGGNLYHVIQVDPPQKPFYAIGVGS